jgi:hypothetical protein
MKLEYLDLANIIIAAGFTPGGASDTGKPAAQAWATVMAESGGDTDALNTNDDGSRDRGIWQINDKAHPTVTDAMAADPFTATAYAYQLSKGGTSWGPWAVWKETGILSNVPGWHAPRPVDEWLGLGAVNTNREAKSGRAPLTREQLKDRGTVIGNVPVVGPAVETVAGAVGKLDDLAKYAVKALSVLIDPRFWKRFGLALAGLAVAVLGVIAWRSNVTTGPGPAMQAGGAASPAAEAAAA